MVILYCSRHSTCGHSLAARYFSALLLYFRDYVEDMYTMVLSVLVSILNLNHSMYFSTTILFDYTYYHILLLLWHCTVLYCTLIN